MVRDIPWQLGSLGIPIVPDGKAVEDKHAVFVRCTGTDFVLVRIVEREHDATQKLTVTVFLGDLDAAAGRGVRVGKGNDLAVCIEIELLNAAQRDIAGRGLRLLTVIWAEGQTAKDHKTVFVGRSLYDFPNVLVKEGKFSSLQRLSGFRIRLQNLHGSGRLIVDYTLFNNLSSRRKPVLAMGLPFSSTLTIFKLPLPRLFVRVF